MSALPQTLESSQELISQRLAVHLAQHRVDLAEIHPDATSLSDEIEQLLSGGKRHRPALCYWTWRGFAPDAAANDPLQHQTALDTAIALEIFQAAALFHDDLMDRSDLRRGLPTAHRSFAARHRALNLSGDEESYGSNVALLLGDLTLVLANRVLGSALLQANTPAAKTTRELFDDMQATVTIGQYLDVQAQAAPWAKYPAQDETRARQIIQAKTASYSYRHPLQLGAALAGGSPELLEALARIGQPLGEAFQLKDDLLGVFGDPAATGKPAGDDLREGKRTVLIAKTLAAVAPGDQDFIRQRLGASDFSPADLEKFLHLIDQSTAVAQVEELIAELSAPALRELASLDLANPARTIITDLTRLLLERTS